MAYSLAELTAQQVALSNKAKHLTSLVTLSPNGRNNHASIALSKVEYQLAIVESYIAKLKEGK
jgi:hypothetical protein